MLVLTRCPDGGFHSTICIGDDVEVTVLEVRGDQVRLGIAAPKGVPVHRLENWQGMQHRLATMKVAGEQEAE